MTADELAEGVRSTGFASGSIVGFEAVGDTRSWVMADGRTVSITTTVVVVEPSAEAESEVEVDVVRVVEPAPPAKRGPGRPRKEHT